MILTDEGAQEIIFAIIKQACIDLRKAEKSIRFYDNCFKRGKNPLLEKSPRGLLSYQDAVKMREDCIKFFRGKVFYKMTNIDPDKVIEACRYGYIGFKEEE